MASSEILKVIGAILLLASMTLPMSSCSESKGFDSKQDSSLTKSRSQNNSIKSEKKYHYIFDHIDFEDPATLVTLLAFFWPFFMLVLLRWKKAGRAALILRGIELLLIFGSLIWIDFVATFLTDSREIGAYLAYVALLIYSIGAIHCDVLFYRNWKRKTQH